jgi:hypothetical protein
MVVPVVPAVTVARSVTAAPVVSVVAVLMGMRSSVAVPVVSVARAAWVV